MKFKSLRLRECTPKAQYLPTTPFPKAHLKYERASIFEYNQGFYIFDLIAVLYKTK